MNADQYEKELAFKSARINELSGMLGHEHRIVESLTKALSAAEVDVVRGMAALAACEVELKIVREKQYEFNGVTSELRELREQKLQTQRLWQEFRSRMNARLDPGLFSGGSPQTQQDMKATFSAASNGLRR